MRRSVDFYVSFQAPFLSQGICETMLLIICRGLFCAPMLLILRRGSFGAPVRGTWQTSRSECSRMPYVRLQPERPEEDGADADPAPVNRS